ncbi:acetyltransferase [Cohnella xylanilytica]|uniref:acyltransferase n=1 Tax=Cohnella xylanilytica TaxID=557555 RepID=UPI001B2B82AB|nr:acyltransferase [Cohnella xylanilytica]GIO12251.1 acetyltransferase [Cohnella xylanilytica]
MFGKLSGINKRSRAELIFIAKKKTMWLFLSKRYGSFGKNSVIEKPLMLLNRKNIYIGENVTIRPNIRIELIENHGNQVFSPRLIIGAGSCIEQGCQISCSNEIVIGKNVTIAAYSYITDTDHEYRDITKGIMEQSLISRKTMVGDQSFIGIGSRVMSGVKIGRHCVVGANSVVTKDVPDYSVVVGAPAKIIKQYDFNLNKWC